MARTRTPRDAWIGAALQALAAGGPDAVRIEPLAASLGVTKGGFYWHFADRQALLDEMLDAWEQAGTEHVIARIDGEPIDARAKIQRLFDLSPTADFGVELALREWGRRDRAIAKRLRRIDDRRMTWLRSLFAEFAGGEEDVEARSMLAYSLLVGAYFIAAQHDGRTRAEILQLAIDRLLT